ncbi:MAG: DNA mismatch repair endonuclease MutL [Firmicutes bacterium]|nr:DNA mismatch repair endonuclease MutL [Bacillota bacterium]
MGIINLLPPEISNKIAAGEVVERPASVVKELVENAIDAGSNVISVEIKKGGITYIRVTDNGCGMAREDAEIAFLRHATSKIQKEEDLDAIYTLGFRGEALSSIGAVAMVDLYTKRTGDEEGTYVNVAGGTVNVAEGKGMPNGTTVAVNNLFFNTPARMRFLKRDASEAALVTDIMERFILSHPEISFRYILDGKDKYFTAGDGKLAGAVYAVYGKNYVNSIIPVEYETETLKISGAIGKSDVARPNRSYQSFFVNKRYVKSLKISNTLSLAYKNQIMIGKHPMAILNIEINPKFTDVNVHPTKLEVKFSNEEEVLRAIYHCVQNALYAVPNVPQIERIKPEKSEFVRDKITTAFQAQIKPEPKEQEKSTKFTYAGDIKWDEQGKKDKKKSEYALNTDSEYFVKKQEEIVDTFRGIEELKEQKVSEAEADNIKIDILTKIERENSAEGVISGQNWGFDEKDVKIIGQVFNTYIIAQSGDMMIIADQHAAHERLKYEELKRELEKREVTSQLLLVPVVIDLSASEMQTYLQNAKSFSDMGFEIEEFGNNALLLRATPETLDEEGLKGLVIELIDQFADSRQEIISDKMQRALYTIACKAAVKANHKFDNKELEMLLKEILALQNINTCPHGRPIIITMSKKELEKEFKRIV